MFGIFKKIFKAPDSRESTDLTISYLNSLDVNSRNLICEDINDFLSMQLTTASGVSWNRATSAKHECIARLNLNDHRHPEFSMYQIIADAYYSKDNHEKIASGSYSQYKFCEFFIQNSKNKKDAEMTLMMNNFYWRDLQNSANRS